MINFTIDPKYQDTLYNIFVSLEKSAAKLYLDTKGHPTIGIGFDVTVASSLRAVTDVLIGKSFPLEKFTILQNIIKQPYTSDASLQAAVNAQMAIFHQQDTTIPATLEFSSATDPRIKTVWTNIIGIYEQRVDNWLSGIPTDAIEREALVSLSYNGLINTGTSPSLKAAIVNGNRAEAWYEIRYDSNGDKLAGIAKRRYYESDIFKPYHDSANITEQEAQQMGQMYVKHQSQIETYETTYGKQVALANKDYGTNIVKTLTSSFQSAIHFFEDQSHITDVPTMERLMVGDRTSSNVNDNLLGTGKNDFITGLTGDDIIDAKSGNDILLGGDGKDTLTGGTGDDFLDGGLGADKLDGGDGIDTVSYANSASLVNVSLARTTAQFGGDAKDDILTNIENIIGSKFHDVLTGNALDNILTGGAGNDKLTGGAGADTFVFASDKSMDRILDMEDADRITFDGIKLEGTATNLGNREFSFDHYLLQMVDDFGTPTLEGVDLKITASDGVSQVIADNFFSGYDNTQDFTFAGLTLPDFLL